MSRRRRRPSLPSHPWPAPLAVLAALVGCVPTSSSCAPSFGPSSRRDGAPARASDRAGARGGNTPNAARLRRADLPRVEGLACPLAFDDADVVLARVGDVVLTACDVAVARALAVREGRAPPPPAAALARLVDEALLADEARRRGMDRDAPTAARVRETLAAALVRAEAVAASRDAVPDDEQVAAYHAAHAEEFASPERVHLREIVLADEAAARAAIRDAAAGATPFDALVAARTVTPEGRRDAGDLGLVPREGNDRVARAVAAAGFALAQPGDVAPEPVRVETTELVGRRRRPHTRVTWHVVQLLGRLPASVVPAEEAARRIRFRLAYGAYQTARDAARERLLHDARAAHETSVDAAALRRARLAPAAPQAPR